MADIVVKGLSLVRRKYRKLEQKFPTLRRNTLNDMARDAKRNARAIVKKKFTNRNKFTIGSIRDVRASNSLTSVSKVGSLQKYLLDQEFGKSALKVDHIPTIKARSSSNKDKLVQSKNKMDRLGSATRRATGLANVRQQIRNARIMNDKSVMKFTFQGKKGRVKGLFRLPTNRKKDIVMVQDLKKSHVTIRKRPWLEPATRKTLKRGQKIFKKNLAFFI